MSKLQLLTLLLERAISLQSSTNFVHLRDTKQTVQPGPLALFLPCQFLTAPLMICDSSAYETFTLKCR